MANDEGDALVCVVDDDPEVRRSLDSLLRATGYDVRTFAGPDSFLAFEEAENIACLILDVRLEGADGLDFQQMLVESAMPVRTILMSGYGDIPMSVRAMRAGAITFLSKPFKENELLAAIEEAVEQYRTKRADLLQDASLRARFDLLTEREREVLGLVTAGLMNKQIAGRLALSEITVKIHRGNLMRKMQAQSLADLVRMAEHLGARARTSRYGG
jgi:Response regulator